MRLSVLAATGVWALGATHAGADTSQQDQCLVWEDWLELDWFTADDPHHQHISYPHPEITHPWGEWKFKGYARGLGEHPARPGTWVDTRLPHGLLRILMVPLLAALASALASLLGPSGADPRSPCPRKAARPFPDEGVVVEVDAARRPPCRVEVRDTGIRLRPSADGLTPDPGRRAVVDSHGRFITANAVGWPAVVSVWDARGRYQYSFGGEGEGPGEFSAMGALSLFIDSSDNLHVRDGSLRWSVFSPDHRFVRRAPADVMGGMEGTTVILDDGSALNSDGRGYRGGHHFRVADSSGELRSEFSPVGDGSAGRGFRAIAYAGGDTFWAAPGEEGADEYMLEEWGTNGTLRRRLHRDVRWYQWRGSRETSPSVQQLHVGPGGLLYVLLWRQTAEYRREYQRARRRGERVARELRDHLTESVLEVIDARSGELLASEVIPVSEARRVLPRTLFRGSFLGYRYEDGQGEPFVDIVEVKLTAR